MARILVGALILALAGCAPKHWESGLASWYGPRFAGKPTASGEIFRPARLTAAHKSLPFGSVVLVEYGDHRVRVVINDRGPFTPGRVLDLSRGAARRLDLIDAGVDEVRWRVVGCRSARGQGPRGCAPTR